MPASLSRRLILAAALAPLALGLAACKKEGAAAGSDTPLAESTPIAKIAAPAGKAWTDMVEVTPEGGYRMGNPNAPIKLIEYGSLSCPHCARLAQEGFTKLMGDYVTSGRVSLEFRSFAIHPEDYPLTILTQCGPKETFFPLAEQIYTNFEGFFGAMYTKEVQEQVEKAKVMPENQRFVEMARVEGMTAFFAQRGLSADQANACLADPAKAQAISKHAADYGQAGIDSTPTLFINGSKVDVTAGDEPWKVLEAALQRAGAR